MASNALVRLTNTTSQSFAFNVEISKPVKFVSRLVIPANGVTEVEVETVTPMVLFDRDFQNAIVNGNILIAFSFTTSSGAASTASRYLNNISRFLAASTTGWRAS